jgi:flagellin FlaB
VVVAAVFSYVVLGAGFFSTQKAQEAVHTGVQQAASSFEVLGDVYGIAPTPGQITLLNFTLGLAPGGMPIDMTKLTMVFANQSLRHELTRVAGFNPNGPGAGDQWTMLRDVNGNGNSLLESGEQIDICVRLASNTGAIASRDVFTLEIKPIVGPALSIARTAPGGIDPVNKLY